MNFAADRNMKTRPPTRLNDIAADAPLYKEVRRRVLDALARGEWKPGERLPNESDLAQRFGVAVSTIRAGVGELTAAGMLVRRQGMGTFVARLDVDRQKLRFSNIYDSTGNKVSTRRQIKSIKKVRADPAMHAALRLGRNASVYVHSVSGVLTVAGNPVAVMELVLPAARFPGLRRKDLEQSSENLYSVYQRVCGVTVVRMEERIHAATANAGLGRKLGVQAGHPVLCVERIAYTFNDVPVEIRRRYYEGAEHHYLFVHDRLD